MINLTRPRNSVLAIHRQIEVTWLALVISFFPVAVESQSARAQAFQTKYSFSGKLDGGWPETGLTLDAHANLYGTAPFGGGHRRGVRFKVTQSGAETVLHSFGGKPGDGSSPDAGLVRDGHGNLYGSTNYGGSDRCLHGCGTVFRLDKTGKETVLYGFGAAGDGSYPTAGLLRDEKGDLYGTTSVGGTYNSGTIFKVDMNGQEIVLYSFTGIEGDGASPNGGLVRDSKGNGVQVG
jgi:uncharacterized repeat protein (TIGR03803 family)